jgi:hypothetical protein
VAAVEASESHKLSATDLGTTSTADSVSPILVKSQSGQNDGNLVPTTPVVSYTFDAGAQGWTFSTLAAYPAPTAISTGGVIGFGLASPVGSGVALNHGSWASPATISGSSQQQGRVYRAVAKLATTATSSDACSGWRLTYHNLGFSHFGHVGVKTDNPQPTGEANTPVSGGPAYETKLFWVAPYFLGDLEDGGGQASTPDPQGDYRKYQVTFDSLATTGDTGNLTMEEIDISYILRPFDMDPVIAWGTGGTAFNAVAGTGGWKAEVSLSGIGFADGTRAINAANMTLNITPNTSGSRYVGVTSQDFAAASPFAPVNQLTPVSNHLYRFSYSVACSNRAQVPTYRCSINGWNRVPLVSLGVRNMSWDEFLAFSDMTMIGKIPFFIWPGQSASVCPGAPSSDVNAPTRIEVYIWSHSVAPQTPSMDPMIYPLLDVADVGNFTGGTGNWADPRATLTFSDVTWEDLGTDW